MNLNNVPRPDLSSETRHGQWRVRRRRKSHSRLHRIRRQFFSLRYTRSLLITVAVFLVVLVVGQIVLISVATNELNNSYGNLTRLLNTLGKRPGSELTLGDFDRLQSSIDEVARCIDSLQQRTTLVRPLAGFNSSWDTQLHQLDISSELVTAAQTMLAGFRPTLFFLVNGTQEETVVTQISSGARVVELLEVGRGSFVTAAEHLDTAQTLFDSAQLDSVPPEALLRYETLGQMYQQLRDINQLLIEAPDLLTSVLGLDTSRSYLILAANSDELRPSGGYLSTYGWMTVRNGRITDYDYSPTTATSPFPPPDTLASEIQVPDWWIQYDNPIYAAWDGSWYADFPSTARMAMWFYNNGGNLYAPVDGVVAIDIYGFEYILKVLGEVRVPDYSTAISVDNFRDVVYNIRAYGQGVVPHKRFVASIYRQIFEDWQSLSKDIETNSALLGAVLQALRERHIMVSFDDARANEALNLLNWSGKQQPATDHDYLMVVDANLSNKSNRSIIRQLTYDVTVQDDGTLASSATVDYDYSDSTAKNDPAVDAEYHGTPDYNNLLQVFIPVGSTLIHTNVENPPQVVTDAEHTNLVSLVQVPYNTSERFQFQYTTPPLISTVGPYQKYRLLIEQQPGEPFERLNVQVRLPSDSRIVSTSPIPAQSYNLDNLLLDFRIDLVSDQWIEVIYTRGQ